MAHSKAALKAQTNQRIREIALEEFAIGFPADELKATMVDTILGAQEEQEMTGATVVQQAKPNSDGGVAVEFGNFTPAPDISQEGVDDSNDRMWVTIAKEQGPGGGEPVNITVNGQAILVHRGVRVPMKMKHLRVLQNTIQTSMYRDESTGEMISTDNPRFNITVHGPAPLANQKEAVAA